jgi:DNA-binding NarL/FixJ family response regulator
MEILVVCNSPILRSGIGFMLKGHYKNAVITETETHNNRGNEKCPDLIIYCLDNGVTHDIDTVTEFSRKTCKDVKRVVYDHTSNPRTLIACLQKGINGYLSNKSATDELFSCIDLVLDGKRSFDNETLLDLVLKNEATNAPAKGKHKLNLTPNETKIAGMLAEGLKISVIAKNLGKSISTISTIKANIFKKLHVENVISLVEVLKTESSNSALNSLKGNKNFDIQSLTGSK